MNPNSSVLVVGSSGNVGAPLVTALRDAGAAVVATTTSRQPAVDAQPLVRRLDFEDASTFTPALEGIRRVFLMRPPQISDTKRYIRPFVSAMAAAGVEHVVFLSLMGVNRAMPHWQVEQDLRASTMSWTFLRPSFFAQNLAGARELLARALPNAFVNVQLLINIVARLGLAKRVDDTLPTLLGRPATPLATYIRDHRNLWMPRPT